MQHAVKQAAPMQSEPAARQPSAAAMESPQPEGFARLETAIDRSPSLVAQRRIHDMMHNAPRMVAQRAQQDHLAHAPARGVAQLASASRLDGSGFVQVADLASLNELLAEYNQPAITLERIYKRLNIGGDDTEMQTIAGWTVREGIQDRFATRATAEYEPPVDAAIQAMATHFWKADDDAEEPELHMGNQTTPYREDRLIGDIRAALGPIIQAMPVVGHYAEDGYSVSLAALDLLRGQVPAISLQRAFECLGNMIGGNDWGGTKLLGNHAQFHAELKINGSGATRILSRNATPTVLDVYRLNGLH